MALQFSRPLFMILLAFLFLGEVAGRQRIAVTFAGFCGILIMLQPFGGGFDPNGIVAVAGAVFGGMIGDIDQETGTLTEPTRRIVFYYAFYTTLFSAIPAYLWLIRQPGGSSSAGPDRSSDHGAVCITHGFTLGEATVTVLFDYMIIYSAILGSFCSPRFQAGGASSARL